MLTLASILLLTAVTMAQADQMSDLLNLPHHKEHIYLYDVIFNGSVDDLKRDLTNFTIRSAFKIVGEDRFLFEIRSNDTAALRALTFPAGSVVTQHPVEHLKEYFEMFGTGEEWQESEPNFPDAVLSFFGRTWKLPENLCSKAFEMQVQEWARQFVGVSKQLTYKAFVDIASYPPKVWLINVFGDNASQNVIKNWLPMTGGYGEAGEIVHKRIVQI